MRGILANYIFDLEDTAPALAGSRRYVKEFGVDEAQCLYNLEMVGIGDVLLLWPATPRAMATGWLAPLANAAKANGFSLYSVAGSILRLTRWTIMGRRLRFISDHASFNEQGYKNACSLTVFPQEDRKFVEIILKRQGMKLFRLILRYYFTKRGDMPTILKHYHNKNDRAEYVEEKTLEKILTVLCSTITLQ